jgi:cysteine desulfurase / selenocysteine lyase
MRPYQGGGGMIEHVAVDRITYGKTPHKFEAGTPPIVEAIGLGAALNYMMQTGRDAIARHEGELRTYAQAQLAELPWLQTYGHAPGKGAIISFTMDGLHPHDIATIIDRSGVAVRAGHHCAQILMERLGVPATTRASFAAYNTREEVDRLIDALRDVRRVFELD